MRTTPCSTVFPNGVKCVALAHPVDAFDRCTVHRSHPLLHPQVPTVSDDLLYLANKGRDDGERFVKVTVAKLEEMADLAFTRGL